MRWFEQHRQEWIAETLRVFGFINREHLERKFGISTPQASRDLNVFQRGNPKAMTYDNSARRYIALATPQLSLSAGDKDCPGHVASKGNPKICAHCGTHIDSLRPDDEPNGDDCADRAEWKARG